MGDIMKRSLILLSALAILAGIKWARPGRPPQAASPSAAAPTAREQEAERQEVARVISSVIGWAKDKNLDLFFSAIAHDEDYISVTPGQRVIKRFEDVRQNIPFWMSPDFQYVRHELKDLEIKFARCGEVAWFFCILDDINTYKGEPASWENTRWTGVVEKRDGRWVVVQQHFSFASDR
jgi:ketosteroid isomerase-like protein